MLSSEEVIIDPKMRESAPLLKPVLIILQVIGSTPKIRILGDGHSDWEVVCRAAG
jgi:hypothetical protein